MRVVREPLEIIRAHPRPFVVLNTYAFGLFLVGFVLGLTFPELVQAQSSDFERSGQADLVLRVFENPWLFALVIFAVNTVTVAAAMITLPSMIVPFLGIAIFGWKAVNIGMAIAPTTPTLWVGFIPHSLTLIIEFEAYVFVLLGAWILGRSWTRPRYLGASTKADGYLRGLRRLGWLGLGALVLLAAGAAWEAWSLTQLFPWLVHVLL